MSVRVTAKGSDKVVSVEQQGTDTSAQPLWLSLHSQGWVAPAQALQWGTAEVGRYSGFLGTKSTKLSLH